LPPRELDPAHPGAAANRVSRRTCSVRRTQPAVPVAAAWANPLFGGEGADLLHRDM